MNKEKQNLESTKTLSIQNISSHDKSKKKNIYSNYVSVRLIQSFTETPSISNFLNAMQLEDAFFYKRIDQNVLFEILFKFLKHFYKSKPIFNFDFSINDLLIQLSKYPEACTVHSAFFCGLEINFDELKLFRMTSIALILLWTSGSANIELNKTNVQIKF